MLLASSIATVNSFRLCEKAIEEHRELGSRVAKVFLDSCRNNQIHHQRPSYHSVIDNCFDSVSLAAISDNFPAAESMREGGDLYRKLLPLSDSQPPNIGTEGMCNLSEEFWFSFQRQLNTFKTRKLLVECINGIKAFGKPNLVESLEIKTLLIRDSDGFTIDPHIDKGGRVFTILIYLPESLGYESLGTRLYIPIGPSDQHPRIRTRHPFAKFLNVKTIEFVPNRALLMPMNDDSWHGVPAIKDSADQRKLIMVAGMNRISNQ